MSAQALSWAQTISTGDTLEHFILREIAEDADRFGVSVIGQHELACRCATTRETVNRKIKRLASAGLLDRRPLRRPDGGTAACAYLVPCSYDTWGELIADLSVDANPEIRAYVERWTLCDGPSQTRMTTDHRHENLTLDLGLEAVGPEQAPVRARPRDELWEAIVEVTNATPAAERSLLNRFRKMVAAESHEDPVAVVRARAMMYRAVYPRMTLTTAALMKHWNRLPVEYAAGGHAARAQNDEQVFEALGITDDERDALGIARSA